MKYTRLQKWSFLILSLGKQVRVGVDQLDHHGKGWTESDLLTLCAKDILVIHEPQLSYCG